jgi:tripartite-type tricarboxylate transporter receptor subunit TctC
MTSHMLHSARSKARYLPRAICLLAAFSFSGLAFADFPVRPVKIIVGSAAGGPMDSMARLFGEKMSPVMKQPVIVENIAGVNGVLAANANAKSDPDGHVISVCPMSTMAISGQIIGNKLPIDPGVELVPISNIVLVSYGVVVPAISPYYSINDLVAAARAKPGALSYATPGVGSAQHLSAELLQRSSKIAFNHIPYKSSTGSMLDIIAGRIDFSFVALPQVVKFVESGKMRLLAQADSSKSSIFPNIARVSETIPGFEVTGWYGFCGSKLMPANVKKYWNDAFQRAMQDSEFVKRLVAGGLIEPFFEDAETMTKRLAADRKRWKNVIDAANISAE